MSNNSPRQFHETLGGYILVGVLIALVSWFIQRALEQRGSPPSAPTGVPESQPVTLPSGPPVAAANGPGNEPRKAESREEQTPVSSTGAQTLPPVGSTGHQSPEKTTEISEPAKDLTSERGSSTSQPLLASELTVAAYTKGGQRYPLHVRLAELSTTAISTKAKIAFTNMASSVLYYKIYYYHELGGGVGASDRFSLVGSDGAPQEWHDVDGVQEASPMTYFKNACLLLPPSVEVSITFGYEKQSPPGRVVVVHTPVRLSQWAPCPGTEIELPEFTLTSALTR